MRRRCWRNLSSTLPEQCERQVITEKGSEVLRDQLCLIVWIYCHKITTSVFYNKKIASLLGAVNFHNLGKSESQNDGITLKRLKIGYRQ